MLPLRAYIEAACAWLAAMAGFAIAVWAVREAVLCALYLHFLALQAWDFLVEVWR